MRAPLKTAAAHEDDWFGCQLRKPQRGFAPVVLVGGGGMLSGALTWA